MAVSVHIPKAAKDTEHADATDITFRDGHLMVLADGKVTVAIYAPGSCTHAEVTK